MMVSVIIPAWNATATLSACLQSLADCARTDPEHPRYECIVVDDASTDDTAAAAASHGARVVTMATQSGPATARNRGAKLATGEVLFFIDADVQLRAGTLARVARHFEADGGADAVIGSYDDNPASRGFFSLYKNLFHHYIHQTAQTEAQTFWAGCGAIRRSAFQAVNGFDEAYGQPSVEDIELGYRLKNRGYRIELDKELQVTHLKHWTLGSMIWTDITRRALPWSRLLLKRDSVPADLNLQPTHRISVALLGAALATIVGLGLLVWVGSVEVSRAMWAVPMLMLGVTVALNMPLYSFFARKVGLGFALLSIPLHLTYYVYSGASFAWVALSLRMRRPTRRSMT